LRGNLEIVSKERIISSMTMAALKKEVLKLPAEERIRLAEDVLESVDDFASDEIRAAWDEEIARRIGELESGKVKPIPASDVHNSVRKALNEARRLSSSRQK
jgi:putative addiction module component (TIGR02574 family)